MTLIIVLIVLGLQHYLTISEQIFLVDWFKSYTLRIQGALKQRSFWPTVVGIILILAPILIVVGLVQYLLSGWFFDIFRFLFELAILWSCIDAYSLKNKLKDYSAAATKSDFSAAYEQSKTFVKSQTLSVNAISSEVARTITREIFIRSDERLFGVLFWFILVGPVATVAYYLVVLLRDFSATPDSQLVELAKPADQLFGLLNWLPVRILGLSYALMGHFVTGFNYCRKHFFENIGLTREFAVDSGLAALNIEHADVIHADLEENESAVALVERTLFIWIVILAVFTLGGWVR